MSQLPPHQQLVAADKWPVVGERAPLSSAEPWTLTVTGLVDATQSWSLNELASEFTVVERVVDFHCVTRWSKPAVRCTGIRLAEVLNRAGVLPTAKYVSFIARSERAHSTSLVLAEALELESLIVWSVADQPLTSEHGGPLRVIVPGRYLYKSLKWLTRIELLEIDRLGYWEAEAGYHNHADPWREERYLAPELTKQQVAALLASRDWTGQALRSLDVAGRALPELQASQALLRDANFSGCDLQRANFQGANLSNARLTAANLQQANFQAADCEGADFTGADLRGANFDQASLFGASLDSGTGKTPTLIDRATQWPSNIREQLTPDQIVWLEAALANQTA